MYPNVLKTDYSKRSALYIRKVIFYLVVLHSYLYYLLLQCVEWKVIVAMAYTQMFNVLCDKVLKNSGAIKHTSPACWMNLLIEKHSILNT